MHHGASHAHFNHRPARTTYRRPQDRPRHRGRAKAAGRADLTPSEKDTVAAKMDEVATLDKQIKGRNLVNSVVSLGSAEDNLDTHGSIFDETAAKGS